MKQFDQITIQDIENISTLLELPNELFAVVACSSETKRISIKLLHDNTEVGFIEINADLGISITGPIKINKNAVMKIINKVLK